MNKNTVGAHGQVYNLDDAKDVRTLLCVLTDGVWNTSDTATFTDQDIVVLNAVRNYDKKL